MTDWLGYKARRKIYIRTAVLSRLKESHGISRSRGDCEVGALKALFSQGGLELCSLHSARVLKIAFSFAKVTSGHKNVLVIWSGIMDKRAAWNVFLREEE